MGRREEVPDSSPFTWVVSPPRAFQSVGLPSVVAIFTHFPWRDCQVRDRISDCSPREEARCKGDTLRASRERRVKVLWLWLRKEKHPKTYERDLGIINTYNAQRKWSYPAWKLTWLIYNSYFVAQTRLLFRSMKPKPLGLWSLLHSLPIKCNPTELLPDT